MAVHFCFGTPDWHIPSLAACAAFQLPEDWTIDRHAEVGDLAVFYMIGPLSAVVAWGIVAEKPVLNKDKKGWPGHFMASIGSIHLLPRPVTLRELRVRVPNWKFLRQPRREIRVPDEHAGALLAALGIAIGLDRRPVAQVWTRGKRAGLQQRRRQKNADGGVRHA